MWMRFEDAKNAVLKFQAKTPKPDASSQEWSKFVQLFVWFAKDVRDATGKMPDHFFDEFQAIFKKGFRPSAGVPLANDWLMTGFSKMKGVEEWCERLLVWLEEGYKREVYPYTEKTVSQVHTKGWWYYANSEKAFLRVWGVDIDISSGTEKTGKGYVLVLLEMLSWPKTKSITEEDFIHAAKLRRDLRKKDYEIARGALDDTLLRVNQLVNEHVSSHHPEMKDKEFIVKNEIKYQVNNIWL